ncbi:hypothetical protein P7C70_g1042, partial [Phenoliferia sp. Uapishka_3]
MFSPQLTLGAFLQLSILFAYPPSPITVSSIRASLKSFHLVSLRNQTPTSAPDIESPISHVADTEKNSTIMEFDAVSKHLAGGQEWRYEGLFVMPQCWPDIAAPSTLEGSQASVRISHKLFLQIRYNTGTVSLTKATTVAIPVIVDSCVALPDSFKLPYYTKHPPNVEVMYSPYGTLCLCEYTIEKRLETFRGVLRAAAEQQRGAGENTSGDSSLKETIRGEEL